MHHTEHLDAQGWFEAGILSYDEEKLKNVQHALESIILEMACLWCTPTLRGSAGLSKQH